MILNLLKRPSSVSGHPSRLWRNIAMNMREIDRRLSRVEADHSETTEFCGIGGLVLACRKAREERLARGISDEMYEAEMAKCEPPVWLVNIRAAQARHRASQGDLQ